MTYGYLDLVMKLITHWMSPAGDDYFYGFREFFREFSTALFMYEKQIMSSCTLYFKTV